MTSNLFAISATERKIFLDSLSPLQTNHYPALYFSFGGIESNRILFPGIQRGMPDENLLI